MFCKWIVGCALFFSTQFCSAKVYDCFPFYNEFEVLKIRMEELWDVVDYFVLVELVTTHKGIPKPLYFEENRAQFTKYLDKIIHVVVRDLPEDAPVIDEKNLQAWNYRDVKAWTREHYQRNCIMRGLSSCRNGDIVIISDVDEIPRSALFPQILAQLSKSETESLKKGQAGVNAIALVQPINYFHLNKPSPTDPHHTGWKGSVFTNYQNLKQTTPQYLREHRWEFPSIPQGGWHFSHMGGRDKVKLKKASTVDGNADGIVNSDAKIDAEIASLKPVPIDSSFPKYVRDHVDYFKQIGYIADWQ